jgi:hypothetical protein
LQQRGIFAFDDREVAMALKLTAEQQNQIWRIRLGGPRFGGREHEHEERDHRSGGYRGDNWKKPDWSGQKARDQVLSLLTPDQRETWQRLTGKPFTLPPPMPPMMGRWGR